ncbi:MAG: hypothetical protein ACTSVL_05020 [Promethearchaeota archaeon]
MLNKLNIAKNILNSSLSELILSFSFLPEQNQLRFDLRNGSRLYIIYNVFGEYAYQLSFSYNPLDRIRFDAMDKKWKVPNPPHHFHPRFIKEGFHSPMTGNPSQDLPVLIDLIISHKLDNTNVRF